MVFLYVKVKQQQSQIFIDAKVVAQQAAIYLFVLYVAILPFFVISCMVESGHRNNIPFAVWILVNVNTNLFGLYIILIYTYFTINRLGSNGNRNGNSNGNGNATSNGNAIDKANDNDNDNGG
mmetsp:Transcript_58941/g.63621  ORF Transcript_58941/g.63621 Transcript_58941/m.63621 type:complete len:122 (-) Transcript_58941:68-433(-)